MTLVIDASVALEACGAADGFTTLADDLAAPPLMWSEARSMLHLESWTRRIGAEDAAAMHDRLENSPVRREDPPALGREAWQLADEFGWARTYDAEYVALAKILKCRLLTIDMRLRRGAERLGFVITPTELRAA